MKRHYPNKGTSLPADSISAGTPPGENRVITWIETGIFAVMIIGAIVLHVVVLMHSGGLWRDEVNTFNTSMLPALPDFWDKMQFESFPILWFLVLRTWVAIGFGETDLALRALGLIVGIGILGTLWLVGRKLEMRFPLVSLVLVALCPTVFWGDTLRAYGLGVILILLAMGSLWRALQDPVPWKISVSLVTAVLSAQCLYHNCFLLFALCIGGAAVGVYRRRWKLIAFPLGVGAIAAASMLPYYTIITKARAWNIIIQKPTSIPWIFSRFERAVDPSDLFLSWIWFFLALFVGVVCAWALVTPSDRSRSGTRKDQMLFLLVTMLVSIVSYIVFIKILSYPTQVWYYLPLMAVLAVILDRGIDTVCEKYSIGRWVRVVCIVGIAACIFMGSWDAAHVRRTNIDLLAAKLESIAGRDDLIVIVPFYCGITFERYYEGSTSWVTLPEIGDHTFHRYDLFKDRMTQNEPIKPVIETMLRTLKRGNRVWLVGGLHFLPQGEAPGDIAAAPHSPYGWNESAYQMIWSRQAAFALQSHGKMLRRVRVPSEEPVNLFEHVPLFVVKGWRS